MEQFLLHYGYWVILIGVLLEGETPVILASILAHRGYFSPYCIALVAGAASFFGDQLYFHIARWKGREWVEKIPGVARHLPEARKIVQKNEGWLIFVMRFLYGMRVAIPAILGISGVHWRKYLVLNLFGAVFWAAIYTSLGFFLGQAAIKILGGLQSIEHAVVLLMLGLIVVMALYRLIVFLRTR